MKNIYSTSTLLGFLALTATSNAAITYTLNPSMTDLSAGIAYWDTTEVVSGGTFVGFHQVISENNPNILTASLNSNEFTFDTAVASFFSMTWEASFMSSGGGGGGAPEVSPSFEDASSTIFISDTNGGQTFFFQNSEFVSGDAVYGDGFGGTVSGMSVHHT